MQLPTIENYGNYSSNNYGVNSLKVELGDLILWYSYKTIIAVRCYHLSQENGHYSNFFVSKNYWGNTTGKHLNWIDNGDKKTRLEDNEFQKILKEALEAHKVEVEE
jgi:hypothetical protein